MGRELWEASDLARDMFAAADDILGFGITRIMFEGAEEDLLATRVTQPAVFIHSVIASALDAENAPDMVAGHSLGEFSALAVAGALTFEDALKLVALRAEAMQKACEAAPGAMAAITRLPDETVERICSEVKGTVVPANYNCPGQLVISGDTAAVEEACAKCLAAGAKRALKLAVGGAFHSPLMESARVELAAAIDAAPISTPRCPVYQNVDALPHTDPQEIRTNLLMQLTSPVLWTQSVLRMKRDGADRFIEYGTGSVLTNLIAKINPA